ncbi:MAG: metalloregulator ArsR/SmtB family transcription factor [Pontixanthobacter sp.]
MNDVLITGLKAIGHPLRLSILQCLRGGERNVSEIEVVTKITQPALSQQLAFLRSAGLVSTRRQAKLVFYATNEKILASVVDGTSALLAGETSTPKAAEKSRTNLSTGAARFAKIT